MPNSVGGLFEEGTVWFDVTCQHSHIGQGHAISDDTGFQPAQGGADFRRSRLGFNEVDFGLRGYDFRFLICKFGLVDSNNEDSTWAMAGISMDDESILSGSIPRLETIAFWAR